MPAPLRVALVSAAAALLIGFLLAPRVPAFVLGRFRRDDEAAEERRAYPRARRRGVAISPAAGTRGPWNSRR
jgi:hypothetical protein